jgi:iron complex transport system substrate-binding protein
MRLVSLACSNTEIVHALGCSHLLVGVDDHSDWPPAVVDPLPKLGPDLEPDVETVAALEPDLVLATLTVPGHEKVVARLEEAGLPFIAPEPVSIPDVYRDIREIAVRLGVPERAEELIAEMRAELGNGEAGTEGADPGGSDRGGEKKRGQPTTPDDGTGVGRPPAPDDGPVGGSDAGAGAADPSRPSILVQWWPKPVITPGRLSWATQLIEAAGGRAVLGHEDVKSRPMKDAEVAERAPDAVVLSWCGVHPEKYRPDVVLRNEAWQELAFVRERRVYCVGEPYLGRPGPRLVEGVRAMRAIVAELRAAGLGGTVGSGGREERPGDAPGATPSSSSAGAPPG